LKEGGYKRSDENLSLHDIKNICPITEIIKVAKIGEKTPLETDKRTQKLKDKVEIIEKEINQEVSNYQKIDKTSDSGSLL
jgi:hypothetical protein